MTLTYHSISLDNQITRYGQGVRLIQSEKKNKITPTVREVLALPVNTFFLNHHSEFMLSNENCVKTHGFISVNDSIGKSVRNVIYRDDANIVIHEDKQLMHSQKRIIVENEGKRLDDIPLQCITIKMPWYNSNHHVIGVFGFCIMMDSFAASSIAEAFSSITNTGLLSDSVPQSFSKVNNVALTKKESNIIYWLIRGKTAKEIATQLRLSRRTVENYLAVLKNKLNVRSKSELIALFL